MTTPAALALLTTSFAEGVRRDRALGLNGALLSGGFTVGALIGGVLVDLLGWRAAFFVNIPVAALLLALTPVVIRESTGINRVPLDLPGCVTVTDGLLALVYAAVERNTLAAVAGVVLLAAFWMVELRSPAPLAPVRILRRPSVKWGNCAGFVIFAMEPAMIFLTTLYLQRILQLSPLVAGLVFGVPGMASVISGVVAGRVVGRVGSRTVLVAGMAVQGLATLPLLFLDTAETALTVLVPALFMGFFGHVAAIVAFTLTATSGLPDHEQGLATGLTSMTQLAAITVGIPILSAVAATQSAQLDGMHLALGVDVDVALTLAAAALVWTGLRTPHPHGVDR
jgi:MFS family permease